MGIPNRLGDWHDTQDDEYLKLCVERLGLEPLRWVAQIVGLISSNSRITESSEASILINDVGCNVGQFYKGLRGSSLFPKLDYLGIDISETYLNHARNAFPRAQFEWHDISLPSPPPGHVT